jgi:1-pyrroline-5-carboxylate dehydrogenase
MAYTRKAENIMAEKRKHIRVTYSTLSSPDPLLHDYFEEDVAKLKSSVGGEYPMYINGEWRKSDKTFTTHSPTDVNLFMGTFYEADNAMVGEAIDAAKAAFPAWSSTSWQQRVAMLRKVADLISERLFIMGDRKSVV